MSIKSHSTRYSNEADKSQAKNMTADTSES